MSDRPLTPEMNPAKPFPKVPSGTGGAALMSDMLRFDMPIPNRLQAPTGDTLH